MPLTGEQIAEALSKKRAEARAETKARLASKIDTTDRSRVQTPVTPSPIVLVRLPVQEENSIKETVETVVISLEKDAVAVVTAAATATVALPVVAATAAATGTESSDSKKVPALSPVVNVVPETVAPSAALASVYLKAAVIGRTEEEE